MIKDEEGNNYPTWEIKLMIGDKIRVYGKIGKYVPSSSTEGLNVTVILESVESVTFTNTAGVCRIKNIEIAYVS